MVGNVTATARRELVLAGIASGLAAVLLGLNFWVERPLRLASASTSNIIAAQGDGSLANAGGSSSGRMVEPTAQLVGSSQASIAPRDMAGPVQGLVGEESSGRQNVVFSISDGGQDTYVGSAYVQEGAPTSAQLSFGGWGDAYYDYLRFNVPRDASVVGMISATLCLFVTTMPVNDPGLAVARVIGPWEERSLTFSSRPLSGAAQPVGPLTAGWNAFDVTPFATAWISGAAPNNGISIQPTRNNQTNGAFASAENPDVSKRPRLILHKKLPVAPSSACSQ